jgi:regulator of RNase E activity RraA
MPKYEIAAMPPRISAEVVELLRQAETATIGHWRHWGFVASGIQALLPGRRVVGTAVTLAIPGPDCTLLHHALGLLRPGDILLVDRLGDDRHACWGGGVTIAAKAAGAVAGVVDGPCTDLEEIEAADFPVWCRGLAPITCRLYDLGGRLNFPVSVGGAVVMPGDAVLCDESGVLVLGPQEAAAEARLAIETQRKGIESQRQVAERRAKIGVLSGASEKVLAALKA